MVRLIDEIQVDPILFQELNRWFSFNLDVCASEYNAQCDLYFTKKFCGLTNIWPTKKRVWCYPPSSKVKNFIIRSLIEINRQELIALLIPIKNAAWHVYLPPKTPIYMLSGFLRNYAIIILNNNYLVFDKFIYAIPAFQEKIKGRLIYTG
jgi:hypothetical protein